MLPEWPEGTVAVLSTAGPHAIPVSTAVRAGDRQQLDHVVEEARVDVTAGALHRQIVELL